MTSTARIAPERTKVIIAGVEYDIIGQAEKMPMRIIRPGRKLSKAYDLVKDNPDKLADFYSSNMDGILDMSEAVLAFALGEEQAARAEDALMNMTIAEYCTVAMSIMSKLGQAEAQEA